MTHQKHPRIICHMMTTIDGKITSGDGTDILSNNFFDLYTKTEDLLPAHTAWMCGRVTMQMFAKNEHTILPASHQHINNNDFIAPHEENMFMLGVDTKGILRWNNNVIQLSNIKTALHLVIITTETTPKEYLHYLQTQNISYLVAGKDSIDFHTLFTKIKEKLGVKTLLLEGGGLLNGSVMSEGLIDEISLLLTPTIINQSQAPSIFERKQVEPINLRHYSLSSVQKIGNNVVWIRWNKTK